MIVPFTGGVTVRVKRWIVKVAPTVLLASMVTEQGPGPVQAPVQAESSYPVTGVAVRATTVP